MKIIIPSFCLVFALQIQASCFSRILSWIPGLNHGEPVSGMSSSVQKDTAVEYDEGTSPFIIGTVDTESWTPMDYEPVMDVDGSNRIHIEERSEIYSISGPDMGSDVSVGSVIASDHDYVGYVGLCRALDEGRLDIAVELGKQGEVLGEEGVDYVIAKKDPDLIVSFVNETNQANLSTLDKLWFKSPIETVEKVLEQVDFPQKVLVDFVSSRNVGAFPETFLVLLNKIVKPEDQGKAVEKGIERLVRWSDETSPLLNALKGKTFRSECLEYFAIQKAFIEGAKHGIVSNLPENICNHAAITPAVYADVLTVTAKWLKHDYMLPFLLKQADQYDLQAVKEKPGYADLNAGFRDAIEGALKTAAFGGTRTRTYDIQSAKIAKETFDEITGKEFSGITDITGSFLTGRPTTRERAKAVRQTIGEVTMTRTPPPTKDIGDILGAYIGEDEE